MSEMKQLAVRLLAVCGLLLFLCARFSGQQAIRDDKDARLLEVGTSVEREIAHAQAHTYLIDLGAGQYLHLVVEQRGVNVAAALYAPDGKKLAEVDGPNGTQGPETVRLIAESAGRYRLQVLALEEGASGKYTVKIEELRAATEQDRQQVLLAEAQQLAQQVDSLYNERKFDEAFAAGERSLAIREKILGANHPDVGASLSGLAMLHETKRDFVRAESLYMRALTIFKHSFGEDHQNYAATLNNLAGLYGKLGDYARALPLLVDSLAIRKKVLPANHPDVAQGLNDLASMYDDMGDPARAELLFAEAIAIYEQVYRDKPHSDLAAALNNLASLYLEKGDLRRAEPLFVRALAIVEKALPAEHPLIATALNNIAQVYHDEHDYARAESLYVRALAIDGKASGPEHPDFATDINNLATLYKDRRDYAGAEALHLWALSIRRKVLPATHPDLAQSLGNLAVLYYENNDYARAESLYLEALAIDEKVYGPEHPGIATRLNNTAALYEAQGNYARAVKMRERAAEIREQNLRLILTTGSENQKRLYLDKLIGETNNTVSLHVRSMPTNAQAAQLALTTILRRKGRELDAMTDQIATLRRRANPQDRELLDELTAARTYLATLQISGGGQLRSKERREKITELDAAAERLEAEVGRRSAEFRTVLESITIDSVRQAIPSDAALVEIFLYRPFDAKAKADGRSGAARYAAYVLRRDTQGPLCVELGEAASINTSIALMREALKSPQRADVKQIARALDDRVMRPIRKLLGPAKRLLLSPDGPLNLIPFAALVDENGKYLIENYSLTYLTSGRDLLRLQAQTESRIAPVVIANPLFDLTAASRPRLVGGQVNQPSNKTDANRRSTGFTLKSYNPLPGTAAEAAALAKLLPQGTQILLQERATEAALKQINHPVILHIATHGFFLSNQPQDSPSGSKLLRGMFDTPNTSALPAQWENPLLRSGLVLAGVKQAQSGAGEDGVLTALETAGLDLWGTKLVVLSACETGLGDVRTGAGVYGLRRALVLAGSQTQVISLWRVSDAGTRDLMTAYYTRLHAGEGRTEALRQVQLAMLSGQLTPATATPGSRRETSDTGEKTAAKDYRHPYYWASFIPSGDWRNMDGKEVPR